MRVECKTGAQWPSPHVSQTTAASLADLAPLCSQASWSAGPENSLHDSVKMHIQVDDRPVQGSHLQHSAMLLCAGFSKYTREVVRDAPYLGSTRPALRVLRMQLTELQRMMDPSAQ